MKNRVQIWMRMRKKNTLEVKSSLSTESLNNPTNFFSSSLLQLPSTSSIPSPPQDKPSKKKTQNQKLQTPMKSEDTEIETKFKNGLGTISTCRNRELVSSYNQHLLRRWYTNDHHHHHKFITTINSHQKMVCRTY